MSKTENFITTNLARLHDSITQTSVYRRQDTLEQYTVTPKIAATHRLCVGNPLQIDEMQSAHNRCN